MQTPTSSQLLDAWAAAVPLAGSARALALVLLADPGAEPARLASLPVGRRDAKLLELRNRLFGPTLRAVGNCPGCGERLEIDTDAGALAPAPNAVDAGGLESIEIGLWTAQFRVPNSRDLAAVEGQLDLVDARRSLLASCLVRPTYDGRPMETDSIPDELARAIGQRMAELDPLVAPEVVADCPACGHTWVASFNLASFAWTEVDAWARRTLHQVHELATAYSWTEEAVLALSAARRARYLELVAG